MSANKPISANKRLSELSMLEAAKTILEGVFEETPKVIESKGHANAVLELQNRKFLIETKSSTSAVAVKNAISLLRNTMAHKLGDLIPLLVVPYMSGSSKAQCQENQVSWLDLSGNARIRDQDLFVLIEGKPNQFKTRGRPRNPFAPKSSRIVRALLRQPSRSYSHSELVETTQVSKALVTQVVKNLEEEGFVRKSTDGTIAVIDPKLLIAEWRDKYSITDHKITRGHIYTRGQGADLIDTLGTKLNQMGIHYAFTGLSSAWHYAPFASFRLAAVYVENPVPIVKTDELGFSPEARGANVWIIEPNDEGVLWDTVFHQGVRFTSPLQTYLDLKDHPERADEASLEMLSFLNQGWTDVG